MSQGQPIPLEQAVPIAEELVERLRPGCARIEIAGSIRRQKATVADIEIVAMPATWERQDGGLWGTMVVIDMLAERLQILRDVGELTPRQVEIRRANGTVEHQVKLGEAYKALVYRGLPVDLFIVRDPETRGTIFALRTGPGDWNTRIVTDCQKYLRRVEGGRVYRAGAVVPCPEEADFFRAVGQPWIEPPDRRVSRVAIQAVSA